MSIEAAQTAEKLRQWAADQKPLQVSTTTPKKPREGIETTDQYLARGEKIEFIERGVSGNKDNVVYGKSTSWLRSSKK